jgi:hypothetical protein
VHPASFVDAASPAALRQRCRRRRRRTLLSVLAVPGLLAVGLADTATAVRASQSTTLFGSAIPEIPAADDNRAVELGVKVRPDVEGWVTGIRRYVGRVTDNIEVGSLWTAEGELLARSSRSLSQSIGWIDITFAAPIPVTAGTTYVASYFAESGQYPYAEGFFASGPFSNGGLTATGSLYDYQAEPSFPTSTYRDGNYYADVWFVAAPTTTTAPAPEPTTTGSPLQTTATVRPPLTTTVAPPPSTWPGATNTGVPAGTALSLRGSMTVTEAGAVLDALDIAGSLTISANNVKVKRSRVRAESFNVVRISDGVTGTVLEDCEIDGAGSTEGNNGVMGTATVQRCNIHGVENGVVPGSGSVIRGSYIHDLRAPGAPHYDGIQIDGDKSDILIQGNTVVNGFNQTSAVMIDNYFGPIRNVIVDSNLLGGGGYTVYVDGHFNSNPILGVSITNNRMIKGYWGFIVVANASPNITGNTDVATGLPVRA